MTMTDAMETIKQLHAQAEVRENSARELRRQAHRLIVDNALCARGGHPHAPGHGFCCGKPYDCMGRQP